MLTSRNMKESSLELPSTAVNLSVAAAAKSSLRCKINEIKTPRPSHGGLAARYEIYCHGVAGKNLQSTRYKMKNIWPGCWGVSAIHVMSKLNRSHSTTYCSGQSL